MLSEFRETKIRLWVAATRGYASRAELERAVATGKLLCEPGPNNTRLVSVADLERLYGRPRGDIYGMHWGDPEVVEPLKFVRTHYLQPLLNPDFVAIEIGPGGGRWTQYLQAMKRVYVVDFYAEMLDELRRHIRAPHVIPIRNNGDDFPGIGDREIDLLFSFDTFVHFDLPLVEAYLRNMWRILKPGARAFIHYSDKRKIMAAVNPGFADNDPATMRALVERCGYAVLQEDTTTMWHSAIIIFCRPSES
jgi:SAM-dependent methyltransferase